MESGESFDKRVIDLKCKCPEGASICFRDPPTNSTSKICHTGWTSFLTRQARQCACGCGDPLRCRNCLLPPATSHRSRSCSYSLYSARSPGSNNAAFRAAKQLPSTDHLIPQRKAVGELPFGANTNANAARWLDRDGELGTWQVSCSRLPPIEVARDR